MPCRAAGTNPVTGYAGAGRLALTLFDFAQHLVPFDIVKMACLGSLEVLAQCLDHQHDALLMREARAGVTSSSPAMTS